MRVSVVGVGADGWAGLAAAAREAVCGADVLHGSRRQLDLLPDEVTGARRPWPSPMLPALPGLLAGRDERRLCVLASGDPMFHGVGATLARLLGADALDVHPHPSSVSLACARLGWALHETAVVSLLDDAATAVLPQVRPGARLLVLSRGAATPAEVADVLVTAGWGPSRLTVLSQLGGPAERRLEARAEGFAEPAADALNVVAVECEPGPSALRRSCVPGLPDEDYEHDGQLTKREVRAVTLGTLGPRPGELLWDVGAGAGSIAVEFSRAHPACRAIAVEHHGQRAAAIERNAAALGASGVRVVHGRAPEALIGLEAPDVVFIGGGVTADGVLEACLGALGGGGRLVANAVTVQSEAYLAAAHARYGGQLTRVQVSRSKPVGGFTGWAPGMTVTQWSVQR